jgi:hypothetical protein
MMKKLLTMGLLLTMMRPAIGQTFAIENIIKVAPRSLNAIKEGSDVKGYYFFYISDKIDKRTNEYTLKIFDNNLKPLKDIKFQDSKDVNVLESEFNGTDLMFLFYNSKERTFDYQVYGVDGTKKPFSYSRELSKKEDNLLRETYNLDDEDHNFKGLYPVEGKGFISLMPSREDKDWTFQLDFFSAEKRKQWTYNPTEGAKKIVGDYLGLNNGVVYLELLKFRTLMDATPDSYIVGLDLATGKQLFEKETDSKYRFYPAGLSVMNNGKAYLTGEFFDLNANIIKDKSKGYAFWTIDEKGKVTGEKYCTWDLDMGRYLNVSSKGKIDNFGFMYLHNIVQTADGNIYAIGEGFKRIADGVGIALKVLSVGRSSNSVTKLEITDMLLIKFDQNFNVKEAKFFDKNSNNFSYSGADFMSTPLLAKYIRAHGGFDYAYTQVNKDATAFTVCYSDYERDKEYHGGTFNSISYNDGKISTDKIKTKTDASYSWVQPGKQGEVLIVDYFKKTKRVEAHFEKLN